MPLKIEFWSLISIGIMLILCGIKFLFEAKSFWVYFTIVTTTTILITVVFIFLIEYFNTIFLKKNSVKKHDIKKE
ncbi:MAG: hypothetical protein U9O55_00255 [Patescibacteria group bacterium]|nr:hypothetical protein [Patescibacteria group bacterium]